MLNAHVRKMHCSTETSNREADTLYVWTHIGPLGHISSHSCYHTKILCIHTANSEVMGMMGCNLKSQTVLFYIYWGFFRSVAIV